MIRWTVISLLLGAVLLPRSSLDAADAKQLADLTTDQPKCYDSVKGLYSVNAMWAPLVIGNEKVTYVVQSKHCAKRGVILCRDACVVPLSSCSDAQSPNDVRVTAVWSRGSGYATRHEFARPEPRCLRPKTK